MPGAACLPRIRQVPSLLVGEVIAIIAPFIYWAAAPDHVHYEWSFTGLSSSLFWNSLSNCIVLNAARVLLIGQFIQRAVRSTTLSQVCYVSIVFLSELLSEVSISPVAVRRPLFDRVYVCGSATT
jgi:hypothetical protein